MISICISLVFSDAEHIFINLLATGIYSVEELLSPLSIMGYLDFAIEL